MSALIHTEHIFQECSEQMQPSVVDMFTLCKRESNDADYQANQLYCLTDLHTQSKPWLTQTKWGELIHI